MEQKLSSLNEQQAELQSENQLLLGLSTLGIAMATFGHETQEAVNQIYNRISPLANLLELLKEPNLAKGREHLQFIEQNAAVVRNWGRFALDHVRRDKRKRSQVRLEDSIRNVMQYFGGTFAKRSIKLTLDLGETPKLSAFPMDVEAIVINFITNALEAMGKTPLPRRFVRVQTRHDPVREEIRLSFADGGRGIPEQHLEEIFSPFFTTKVDGQGKPMGTGLGLTIVKKIVEDELDGTISVVGRHENGGAQFTIRIPTK